MSVWARQKANMYSQSTNFMVECKGGCVSRQVLRKRYNWNLTCEWALQRERFSKLPNACRGSGVAERTNATRQVQRWVMPLPTQVNDSSVGLTIVPFSIYATIYCIHSFYY